MGIYKNADSYLHITPEQLKACLPNCKYPVKWARAFDYAIEFFDIQDIAILLAHVGHESLDLTRLEENLNYSMLRLREVWPSRFPSAASAAPYVHNPQALANNVYANRMGNGPPSSGDGWRYRGQGPIMITGKSNARAFAEAIGDRAPLDNPALLQQPAYGAMSACWYMATRVTPGATLKQSTKQINGGYIGLADRQRRYDRCIEVLS